MATLTKRPLRMLGGIQTSGAPYTGEVPMTRGGQATATVCSGAIAPTVIGATGALGSGGSSLIISGAGRLNSFTALFPAGVALAGNGEVAVISGQPIVVYDSAITARSGLYVDGTISESGRKILYSWQPPRYVMSGSALVGSTAFDPKPLDVPFFSGLCVLALSGAPGFTLSYTPEYSPVPPFTQ